MSRKPRRMIADDNPRRIARATVSHRPEHAVHTPDGNANSRNQGLAIDVGPSLRRSREMVTIGNLENMPSALFNLWRK